MTSSKRNLPDGRAPAAGFGRVRFSINKFVRVIKNEYRGWDAPVITLIADRGASPFEVLVSTLLSLRTKDAVTHAASGRLFAVAHSPEQILRLSEKKLAQLIYPVGFYATKAKRLKQISRILVDDYGGGVPGEIDQLLQLPGVGRKTANLVLIEGFGKAAICVDTHVHRISNRIGFVETKTPEKTEYALIQKLPRKHWIRYNELLVAFGQVICRPISPLCSVCPVSDMCPRMGVTKFR